MIQSVERALDLLTAVAGNEEGLGVRELARITGLKPPTAQNLLKTLAKRGLLEFNELTRTYRVGHFAIVLADHADSQPRLERFARPYMLRIVRDFHETLDACALVNGRFVRFAVVDSPQVLAVREYSRTSPYPHCSASGVLLYAYSTEAFQRAYAEGVDYSQMPPKSPQSAAALLQHFGEVRARGYGENVQVTAEHMGALGVPVLGPGGSIELSLGLSGPIVRFDAERRARILPLLLAHALTMSRALGYRGAIPPAANEA